MAEYGASIVAFIQLADRVIRICSHIISATKDAPRDMVIISGEITSLRAILSCFDKADLHPRTAEALPSLFASNGSIQACYRSIADLDRLLPNLPADSAKKPSFRLTDLAWVLKEGQVRKLLAEINLHKSSLLLALTGDLISEIKDIKAGVERVEQALSDSDRYEALKWLQSKSHDPSGVHTSMLRNHEKHTNSWLHKWDQWEAWLRPGPSTEIRLLWIHGIPGAGKSVMASSIIESVKTYCGGRNQLGYAYYYCQYSHKGDEASSFLRWVIGQLCRQAGWAPQQLKQLRDSGCDPTSTEMLTVLEAVLERFDTAYLVIDGVDESEPRSILLSVLATLATSTRLGGIRLVATSRLSPDIENTFSGISASISMSNEFVEQDIRTFVHEWMVKSPHMARWGYLAQRIEDKLCREAQGMFRWVVCQIQVIESIREESELLEALNNLPHGIDEVYLRLLASVPERDRLFVRRVLLWIAGHASSAWLSDEGIHIDVLVSAVCDDLLHMTGRSYRYTAGDLRELCGCLITAEDGPLPFTDFLAELHFDHINKDMPCICRLDNERSVPSGYFVKIAHYTVLEFLLSDRITASSAQPFSMTWGGIYRDFSESVLRQSLAADPIATSVDWVRDRESYCLTLAPFIIQRFAECRGHILESRILYFLPTSPHFPRLRLIQYYLATGCNEVQMYYLAKLPIYHPALPPSTYERNDPHAWALLGMMAVRNFSLAGAFMMRIGWDHETDAAQELHASFLDGGGDVAEDGTAQVTSYRGMLRDIAVQRGIRF